ncbi:MAG: glycosyltransferase family 4 protein [Aggregatilineales bacterium]
MRLVIISSWPTDVIAGSGTAVFFQVFTSGLKARGYTVELLTPNFDADDYVAVTRRRFAFNAELVHDPRIQRADLLIGFDYDGYALDPVQRPPLISGALAVYGDIVQWEKGAIRTIVQSQARRDRLAMSRAAAVATGSEYAKDRIVDLYCIAPDNVEVIPNGLQRTAWMDRVRAVPRAPNDHPIVLSVGKMYPRKRAELTLQAASLLLPKYPTLEVRVVGDGIGWDDLHAEAERLNLGSHVTWLGHIADDEAYAREWRQADVLCHPSSQETFGFVCLEAMALGVPVVAARAGAVPEVIGDAGLLAEPNNAEDLVAKLDDMLADEAVRRTYAERSQRRAQQFTMTRMMDGYERLIERVVSGSQEAAVGAGGAQVG